MWFTIPNAGKIKMYTSGWPKNQKRCWYKIGSPPPLNSKNEVPKWRSVKSIVIAPAKTGKAKRSRVAVIRIDQTNKDKLINKRLVGFIRVIVTIKFIEPIRLLRPLKWRLKIARSTAMVGWPVQPERGGYTVQPVPAPFPTKEDRINKKREGGNSHKDKLFNRGKAMSTLQTNRGRSQLPIPPMIAGITTKKIIINACAVITEW